VTANLRQLLESGAAEQPALVVPGGLRLTYRQLRREVELAAGRLAGFGVRSGDRVASVTTPALKTVYDLTRQLDRSLAR
jgi:acyl-coenzyme A synthetase/AMP-(fatty) acid ligase